MTEIASIVWFSARPHQSGDLLQALGVPLAPELHDEEHAHWAAELDGVHLAVYDAADVQSGVGLREAGSVFVGLYVQDLNLARERLLALGIPLLTDHQVRPWGCRIIVADPDGRAIEVNQRGHCGPTQDATGNPRCIALGESGASIDVLTTAKASGGSVSAYRWRMAPSSRGPAPHFHTTFNETFVVEAGEVDYFDGKSWRTLCPGDTAHASRRQVHAIRKNNDESATLLMLLTPGVAREDYFAQLATADEPDLANLHIQHDNHFVACPAEA